MGLPPLPENSPLPQTKQPRHPSGKAGPALKAMRPLLCALLMCVPLAAHAGGACRDDSYCASGFSCQPVASACVDNPLDRSCRVNRCLPAPTSRPPFGEPSSVEFGCSLQGTPAVVFDAYGLDKHARLAISGRPLEGILQGVLEMPLPQPMVAVCEPTSCRFVGGAVRLLTPFTAKPGSRIDGIVYVDDPEGPAYLPFRAIVSASARPIACRR